MTKKHVHVCLTPALIDQFDVSQSIVVVIDILRATTSMCAAFDNGADHMIPVEKVDQCRSYRPKGYLLAGERDGIKIEDFDFGNSPFSYFDKDKVEGAKIAITTTNGTRALEAAKVRNAKEIVIGSFCNISLITKWLKEQNQHICLVCAGWRDNVTLEDSIYAGALMRKLRHHFNRYQDTALVAEALFINASKRKRFFFRNSSHFNRLIHLNLQKEVKYAMRNDTHSVLPLLVGDRLYDMSRYKQDYKLVKDRLKLAIEKEDESPKGERNPSSIKS